MKPLFYLIALSISVVSCGGEATTSTTNDSDTDTSSLETELLNTQSGDSLVASYKKIRMAEVETDEEFYISGDVFYADAEFIIVNLEEHYGQYHYPFSIVLNQESPEDKLVDYDGMYPEITEFIHDRIAGVYSIYPGNFVEAPNYELEPSKAIILSHSHSFRTDYSRSQTLYLLRDNHLTETNIVSNSMGMAGECDEISGYEEEFIIGDIKSHVVVKHAEYHYYEGCSLEDEIHYNKVWSYAAIFGGEGEDQGGSPTYFEADYMENELFTSFPKYLYALHIDGEDTLIGSDKIFIEQHSFGPKEHFATMTLQGMHDMITYLIIGIEEAGNPYIDFHCRYVGFNFGEMRSELDLLRENESAMSLITYTFNRKNLLQGIIIKEDSDPDRRVVYTTDAKRFPELEWEEDI